MELLYIWVEELNNIKHQGFNFSLQKKFKFEPKFENDNPKERITGGKLYHENIENVLPKTFFDKNIMNVTGIVGKNGTGKTSLTNMISHIIDLSKEGKNVDEYIAVFETDEIIFVNFDNWKISFDQNTYKQVDKTELKKELEDYQEIIYANHYETIYKFEHIFDIRNYPLLKTTEAKKIFNTFDIYKRKEFKKQIKFIIKDLYDKQVKECDIKLPNSIDIDINKKYFKENTDLYEIIYNYVKTKQKKLTSWLEKNNFHNYLDKFEKDEVTIRDIRNEIGQKTKKQKSIEKVVLYFENLKNMRLNKFCNQDELKFTKNKKVTIRIKDFKEFNDFLEIYHQFDKSNELLIYRWSGISSGEQAFFTIYSRLFDKTEIHEKNLLIVFDEIDTYFHPELQRNFFNFFLDSVLTIFPDRKIQIILTSHSPFVCSDLPKENIIFLEKDKTTGKCIVSDLKDHKQTFGANIHTLFSDSFFMKDGLIGEFAKQKIDNAIELLTKNELTKEEIKYCEQIISIIGEPIIKNFLQKSLDSKRLKKIDKIELIEKQIEDLTKELSDLKTKEK